MSESTGDKVEADTSIWNRKIRVNSNGIFRHLTKAAILRAFGAGNEAFQETLEAAQAIGLARTPAQLAGALLERAMERALRSLLLDHINKLPEQDDAIVDQVCKDIDEEIAATDIELDRDFLRFPENIKLISVFQEKLEIWLHYRNVDSHEAQTIASHIREYFVDALHVELQEKRINYRPLLEYIDAPAEEAWERTRSWQRYRAAFRKGLAAPVFGEAFSLAEIFVWPVAYFERTPEESIERHGTGIGLSTESRSAPKQRHVVELKEALDHWLEGGGETPDEQREDAIRLISGDPGAGKSSFLRMYAAHRMQQSDHILFVPLHQLNVTGDFGAEIENFCAEREDHPVVLMSGDGIRPCLLLILDGLDELSKQGDIGEAIASAFVDEVIRKVSARNAMSLRVRVIISGRPIAIQGVSDKFRREEQVYYMLPYYIPPHDRTQKNASDRPLYVGQAGLLDEDRREVWWKQYGRVTGRGYTGMPSELASQQMYELTTQPLLNYLLALVYESVKSRQGKAKLDFGSNVKRNELYDTLLNYVYQRDWDQARRHRALTAITNEEFRALLQEMALTAWHERDRTTSASALRKRCEGTHLADVLRRYEARCGEGVSPLFVAFYFRRSNRVEGLEPAFEFTHKSFGEYLTSQRLVAACAEICDRLSQNERLLVTRFTEEDALRVWLKVCGPSEISVDLARHIREEIARHEKDNAAKVWNWQKTIVRMLEVCMVIGMPCENRSGHTFREMCRQARNAEEALLVMHSACFGVTNRPSVVRWPSITSAGELIHRIRQQRNGPANPCGILCLDGISFSEQRLDFIDLYYAGVERALFDAAEMYGAVFECAHISGASFAGATLTYVNMQSAVGQGINLDRADVRMSRMTTAFMAQASLVDALLQYSDLREVMLMDANLTNANMFMCDLSDSKLMNVIAKGVCLQDGNLSGASLEGAVLEGAEMRGAQLNNAKLVGAVLEGAELEDAILVGADLLGARMRGANLKRAMLNGANLEGADLENANLEDADVEGANFKGANLNGAILKGTGLDAPVSEQ